MSETSLTLKISNLTLEFGLMFSFSAMFWGITNPREPPHFRAMDSACMGFTLVMLKLHPNYIQVDNLYLNVLP